MQAAVMPFTYLSASTARMLAALVGPIAVYQPLQGDTPEHLTALAAAGAVDLRTPVTGDDDRLRAALAEFTQWARENPGRSTAGTDYLGARQGAVPFSDDNSIHRIRSDIRRYQVSAEPAAPSDAGFSLRLFLALAQANDHAVDRLDQDLDRIHALEDRLLAVLKDADDAAFTRRGTGNSLWRDDPGARLTMQRIRAWAGLAGRDAHPPQWLVTTSAAVMEAIVDAHADGLQIAKLAAIRLPMPAPSASSLLVEALTALSTAESPTTVDLAAMPLPAVDAEQAGTVAVSLFAAVQRTPDEVIRQLGPATDRPARPATASPARHTLLVLVDR